MIEVTNLTKVYKLNQKKMKELRTKNSTKIAVDNMSFTAKPGEIYGLLGPNGAGKTTTLRCISTLLKPTEGEIKVCNLDTLKEGQKVREKLGFLTNDNKLDPNFTPLYLFNFFGSLYGTPKEELNKRRAELFDYFDITSFENKKIEELSTGMKQKASIAVCLAHDPEVIIFDEPTSGLDIITARNVTDLLLKLKEQGKTVIISTHIMSEAEKLCDRVGIIIDGKKVEEGTIQDIVSRAESDDLEDAFFKLYSANHREEA